MEKRKFTQLGRKQPRLSPRRSSGIGKSLRMLSFMLFCILFSSLNSYGQVTPPNANSDAECGADCFDLFNWDNVQDGSGNNIPNFGEGIASDANCNTIIDASVEYSGSDATPDLSGTALSANRQGNTPWTDTWSFSFGAELTMPIFRLSGLFNDSEVVFLDCSGNPISVTDIATGTVIASGMFSGNDEVQLNGTYDCVIVTVSNDRNDAYNLTVGTCLSAAPNPPCVNCGPNENFRYLTLTNRSGTRTGATADVELNGILVGTAEVLFSDLDINEDLSGSAFGAFDNDGGVFVLQMDFCDAITIQQIDILGLETESQAWVGNALTGTGMNGIPTGFNLTQCGGRATMAPTGSMVTNTSPNCANQGNGNYTVSETVSTLFFRYENPTGGCVFDKATFRIGSCVPSSADAVPTCPLTVITSTTDMAAIQAGTMPAANQTTTYIRDANGNTFNRTCSNIENAVNSMTAIPTITVSPCAEVIDEADCNFCDPAPPCTDCGENSTYRYVDLRNYDSNTMMSDVFLDGVLIGSSEVITNTLTISEDLSGIRFGAFANGRNATEELIIKLDFCEPLDIQQVDILGLETDSEVFLGTSINGSTLSGLTIDDCGTRTSNGMIVDGTTNSVRNMAPNCNNQGNGNYTLSTSAVSTLYFRYLNEAGSCSYDKTTYRIGVCTPELPMEVPVCPIEQYTVTEANGSMSNVYRDGNGNYFDGNCPNNIPTVARQVIAISPCATVDYVEDCTACVPTPTCAATTCGPDEEFGYVTFRNGEAILPDGNIGTLTVLYEDLDYRTDVNGSTFGGFDNDGGTMVMQIDFCEPLDIKELTIVNLEVESEVSIGTTISGTGAAATLGGMTLTVCDDPSGRMGVGPGSNFVKTDGPGCGANPNATYTLAPTPVTTLYFKYYNPPGGCRYDYVGFRIGVCTPAQPEVIPACPLEAFELTYPSGEMRDVYRDRDGNWFNGNCPSNLPTTPQQSIGVIEDCVTLVSQDYCGFCPLPGLAKAIDQIAPAASGVAGNVDITFKFTLSNYINVAMTNLVINDNLTAIAGFVQAFPGQTSIMISNNASGSAVAPSANPSYNGTGNILNGSTGNLLENDEIMVFLTSEFDASQVPNNIANVAQGGGAAPGQSVILDDSVAGTDPDPDGDGNPANNGDGDPNNLGNGSALYFPSINASKNIVGFDVAASGVPGNVDAVFEIEVCNTGNVELQNITLMDDLQTQLGAAFVSVVSMPATTITASTATINPTLESGFNGAGMPNIFNGTSGSLLPGQCVTIQFTTELDLNAAPLPISNQAMTSGLGIDPVTGNQLTDLNGNNIVVSDKSDSGANPNSQNPGQPGDTGSSNDPTMISIPQVSLTKNFVSFSEAASGIVGNVDVVVEYNILNTGTVDLSNLSLIDDFMANFGSAYVGVVMNASITSSTATTNPILNGGFNGTGDNDIFNGTSGLLEPNQLITVQITIEMDPDDPGSNLPDVNQATISGDGVGPNGTVITVSDDSDDGVVPETTNPGEPGDIGGVNDPSPFNIPQIHLTKDFVSIQHQSASSVPGNVDIVIEYNIENTGNVNLSNVDLIDDLNAAFGSTLVSIISAPTITASTATTNPALNGGYTGTGNNNMFDGMSGLIEPNQIVTIQITLEIDPNAAGAPDPIFNQATTNADGVGPDGTVITVSDDSDSGSDTETTNSGEPGDTGGHNDPTPFPLPAFNIAKNVVGIECSESVTRGNFNVIYEVLIENTGNVDLTNFNLIDVNNYGSGFVAVVEAPELIPVGAHGTVANVTTAPTANGAFFGNGSNLVIAGGLVRPGELFIIQYTLELSSAGLNAADNNQIQGSASGMGLNGVAISITELSDSGFTPESTNPGRLGDSGGHNDPTPITDCFENMTLVCNVDVQVSVDEDCHIGLTPDMILEAGQDDCTGDDQYPLGGYYDFEVTYQNRTNLTDLDTSTPNVFDIDGRYIGDSLVVRIIDKVFKNSCWGTIHIEDKFGPSFNCSVDLRDKMGTVVQSGTTFNITCDVDPASIPAPQSIDNCDNNVDEYLISETITGDECGVLTLTRLYGGEDSHGNEGNTCEITINITQPTVEFPEDITWTCEQYAAYSNIVNPTALNILIDPAAASDLDPLWDDNRDNCNDRSENDSDECKANFAGTFVQCVVDPNAHVLEYTLSSVHVPALINGLEDADVLERTGSGVPSVFEKAACKFTTTWQDQKLVACDNVDTTVTFKILRTWTVLNWCSGEVFTDVQVIKVTDEVVPTIDTDDLVKEIKANKYGDAGTNVACASSGLLGVPTFADNCSGVDFESVRLYTPVGEGVPQYDGAGNLIGFAIPAPYLPTGTHTVTYEVTDNCGNKATEDVRINVIDGIPPVSVCREFTQVSLSGSFDGTTTVTAEHFNEASFDNCSEVYFLVRKMESSDNCNGFTEHNRFRPEVHFCCENIGDTINVILKVYDRDPGDSQPVNGLPNNSNECMVRVLIEDKIRPECDAPEDVWTTCDEVADNLDLTDTNALAAKFGDATATDNCGATTEESAPIVDLDLCGVGTVTRNWVATDDSDNRSLRRCQQVIMIMAKNSYKINIPGDFEEECDDASPAELTYEEFACDLIAVNVEEQDFPASTLGECKKVFKTWKVINWCEYDGASAPTRLPRRDLNNDGVYGDGTGGSRNSATGNNLNSMHMYLSDGTRMILNDDPNTFVASTGYYEYKQHVKIFDNTAPELSYAADVQFCGGDRDEDPCTGVIDLPIDIDELCTNTTTRWELTAFSSVFNGADFQGNGTLSGRYPLGTHTVRYYVEDECRNIAQLDITFEIIDCKAPTPVCYNGLSVDLMPTGMVSVWASDFDASSFDYCHPIKLAANVVTDQNGDGFINADDYITTPPSDTEVLLTCDNVGTTTYVQLWVGEVSNDNRNNWDYCVTFIDVQDNLGACAGSKVALAGKVTTEEGESVENVMVDLNNGINAVTTANGEFNFNLPLNSDITVTPMRNDDAANGVSTFDLIKISKHILNVEKLNNPYKMIAADANNSGNISTLDLISIRKVILRVADEFPNNTSWRFVAKDYTFQNAANPWDEDFQEAININNLTTAQLNADFTAIKVGDVNGDATPNSVLGVDGRTFNGNMILKSKEQNVKAGEQFTIALTAGQNVEGFQFTMTFEEKSVELISIENGLTNDNNFNVIGNQIVTSWNDKVATAGAEMFSLTFLAKADIKASDVLTIGSQIAKAEAYNANGDLMKVSLDFGQGAEATTFELMQNTPNPFQSETVIGFILPEATTATLTIADVSGKILQVIEGDYAKGFNQVTLKRSGDLPAGVLVYELKTPTHKAIHKMTAIK